MVSNLKTRILILISIVCMGSGFTAIAQENYSSESRKFIYMEGSKETTRIWMSYTHNIESRSLLTKITHAEGYPIKASLSPDGTKIAYTLLSSSGQNPSLDGSLFFMDIEKQSQVKLDKGINYYIAPRWSQDSTKLVYLKTVVLSDQESYRTELCLLDLRGSRSILLEDDESLGISPIGYSPNGKQFYFDRIISEGDELWAIDLSTNTRRFIAPISIGAAWNLAISPDGSEILGSVIESREPASYAVVSISVDGKRRHVWTKGAQRHYTPIWGPKADEITANIPYGAYPTIPGENNYKGELKILNRKGKDELKIGESNDWMDAPISWLPNRNQLIFERYRYSRNDLLIMNNKIANQISPSNSSWVMFVGWANEAY